MSAAAALTVAVLALTALVVVLAACIAGQRVLRRRREARRTRLTLPVRPLLLELAAGEDEEQTAAWRRLTRLDRATWHVVEPGVVALIGKVRGASRTAVVRLLDEQGVIRRAREDLDHRSAVRRAEAAELLGAAGVRAALPRLVELLDDGHGDVRVVAARALGGIGDARAAAPLLAALAHEPPRVPAPVAARALLHIGLPGAEALTAALTSPAALARATSAEVLGRVGAVGAVERLVGLLHHDAVPEVRSRAATALGRLGMPGGLPGLVFATAAAAPTRVRVASTRALGELGDVGALDRLLELLDDPDELVAAEAGPALLRLGTGGRDLLRTAAAPAGTPAAERAREVLALAELGAAAS